MSKTVKLGNIAHVDISSIDKKTKAKETAVKLCNYTDVYYNWTVTEDMITGFMEATAKDADIDVFKLKQGQVAITKDSETKDDIGMACYIADDMDNVVLGYHCALITPNENELDGRFLNAILQTDYARKYFGNSASGSGQRYTLIQDFIEAFPVPFFEYGYQKKIGKLFDDIDHKIINNNCLIECLNKKARILYNHWMVDYEYPGDGFKHYCSDGGDFRQIDELGIKAPAQWKVHPLSDYLDCNLYSYKKSLHWDYINYLDTSNLTENLLGEVKRMDVQKKPSRAQRILSRNDILFSTVRPNQHHYGIIKEVVDNMIASTGFAVLTAKEDSTLSDLLYMFLTQENNLKALEVIANSSVSSYPSINNDDVLNLKIVMPENIEILYPLCKELDHIFELISNIQYENKLLIRTRDFLLPLIISGQAQLIEAKS